MISLLAVAWTRWKVGIIAAGVGLAAFAAGYLAGGRKQTQSITEQQEAKSKKTDIGTEVTHAETGPVDRDIERRYYEPIPSPTTPVPVMAVARPTTPTPLVLAGTCPDLQPGTLVMEEHIHEHVGPSIEDTKKTSHDTETSAMKLDLKIVDQPRYSILVGSRLLPDQVFALGGATRFEVPIIGNLWLQLEVQPRTDAIFKSQITGLLRKDF